MMSHKFCASSPYKLGELFSACDLDGSGYIDENELASFCSDLSADEVADVFKELDRDRDGRISITEFSDGFREFTEQFSAVKFFQKKFPSSDESDTTNRVAEIEYHETSDDGQEEGEGERFKKLLFSVDEGFKSLSCQEHVCELYQSIHNAQLPHLTTLFENVVLSVIRDIKQHQYENERLERSYKRDKEQHSRHLRQLEEEMEAQMSRVEARVKEEDREKHETEKEELRRELETEIGELTKNIKKLQKVHEEGAPVTPTEDFKHRVDELHGENRQLKSCITDAQTNLALSRSEAANNRQQFEEKCYELESEKETLMEYIKEQENLTRQVHLLQDANKKLHDTNDDLRSALDTSRMAQKRSHVAPSHTCRHLTDTRRQPYSRIRTADFVSDFINSSRQIDSRGLQGATLADELQMSYESRGRPGLLPSQDTVEVDSIPDDIDSGHSTLRDLPDLDSEYEPNSIEDDMAISIPRKRNRIHRGRHEYGSTTESELPESQDEMDTEVDQVDGEEEDDDCYIHPSVARRQMSGPGGLLSCDRAPSVCSRTSTCSCGSGSAGSLKRQASAKRRTVTIQKPILKDPERMYKVVLAGDAAVGKSSFIMRLCKDKFVNNISSTLGVDFQTKIIEVDGRVIALQLWDTAGQERFRSIAKSYFRRADGVLLLYDCTYERSFISVREWIDAVEDGAQKKIPIMMCGNKTDLRDQIEEDESKKHKRMVKTEEGQRLAKECEALFIETSAKDNSNVCEAVTELARMLRTYEDLEVQSVGMQLNDLKINPDKKQFRCCNS